MHEFEIIEHYFASAFPSSQDNLRLGIGDDAAIISLPEDTELVVSMDTLLSDVHFFAETSAEDIAYKAINVNLSDIATMGGSPRWLSLSLTLPNYDEHWLQSFASSFIEEAKKHNLILIGGDMNRGPLAITLQAHGMVPKGRALRRSGANKGDAIYVTGELGAAAYALNALQNKSEFTEPTTAETQRLHRPEARVKTGMELRAFASSCIDISDGLIADLGHVLKASSVGADLELNDIPMSASLSKLNRDKALELALTGGDDYELCFTLPASTDDLFIDELDQICPIKKIGMINDAKHGLVLKEADDQILDFNKSSYRHF